jgi:acetyl esterase/lipase
VKFLLMAGLLAIPVCAQLRPMVAALDSGQTRTYIFKNTPQGELKIKVYLPEGWKPGQKRAAILMWFGGGFTSGTPAQFHSKAEYLASRGMVAFTPEYRIKSLHKTEPDKSFEDAKSAVRWVRTNAEALGVDPNRIVGSGGSAGGTCALITAYSDHFESESESRAVSSKPNALVLFNPAVILPDGPRSGETLALEHLLGTWKLTKGGPPMILLFGSEDKWLLNSREMAKQLVAMGNRADLYVAPGVQHGFFNDSRSAKNGVKGWHEVVLNQTDLFLASLGYLQGKPAVHTLPPELKLEKIQ